ncbi:ABC transporter ATP-binding protein [Occultella aeris]|uniref:Glutathione import ATP-binding protein GsiA n=1 Tax=Occultella aeris TaxID=2761496 RepID=A0A7M4DFJ4_9MICO|nr:ABC transporter ATP-binding protein [Occultella aeris]VZO35687.1 Glutathione import ATP-binding protein GsiA [Occultella aeris]
MTASFGSSATLDGVQPTAHDPQALLSVRDLRVSFAKPRGGPTATVVEGVSFDIEPGASLAVVGESGSGKTVTMRALLRLLPETASVTGQAMFGGQDLISLPDKQLRAVRGAQIGMVFQNAMSALNPTRTLKVQLTEHLRWHGITDRAHALERAIEALDRVGIPEPRKRIRMYPFQLSGGQRQRAMIAMAIVARPKLLIADEPTTALDVTIQRQVLDLLEVLRGDGISLAMITHDLGVARYLCDDVVVMRHGVVVEAATVDAFVNSPSHPYSRQLLRAAETVTALDPATSRGRTVTSTGEAGHHAAAPTGHPHQADGPGRARQEPFERTTDLVAARDLVKVFQVPGGEITAVRDVDLTIESGETVGIVGESGSGKSTLARLIARLIEPTTGALEFDGDDALTLSGQDLKAWRRRVQLVFQNPYASLLPHLTVASNVAEPLKVHRVGTPASRRARALELLELVGIPETRADQYPRQFSGGQQQRIAIARALALEPDLLVCDEPTSALDVSIQGQILDLLQRLKAEMGLSMLFITHNLAVAQRICDRIIVMANGTIVESATAADLFGAPQHPYTRELLASVLPIHGSRAVAGEPIGTAALRDEPELDLTGELVETAPGHWVRSPG